MTPTEWLADVKGSGFYAASEITKIRVAGIIFDPESGVFTSRITWDRPYITYGRLSSVSLLTEREIISELATYGQVPNFDLHHDERMVLGFHLVTAIWSLLRPIIHERPPSSVEMTPDAKARVDLEALRRYGY